ncbi:prepilin peptidase CpaA [Sphingomonas laterariae]|uniref:Prepilin peptidase CpaA n=1 Tax=Edaphosphingomonas laterariae TaxID=861865 RepID=A0A239IAN7_9SPHN|nr:prepilin peptidase [Sphingomonas laterariae]SNS89444.1 prepilin peptidase CpaA [Sphingomonas laterariae]
MGVVGIIILAGLAAALLYVMWSDLRTRTIPNGLNAAIALAAPLWWFAQGLPLWPDAAIQIALAAGVFALFAACFAIGAMGGGDVKLLAALALWLPPIPMVRMLMVMAIAGGVLTIAMVVLHRARKAEGRPEIPYGVAISLAGLWALTNHILTTPAA